MRSLSYKQYMHTSRFFIRNKTNKINITIYLKKMHRKNLSLKVESKKRVKNHCIQKTSQKSYRVHRLLKLNYSEKSL